MAPTLRKLAGNTFFRHCLHAQVPLASHTAAADARLPPLPFSRALDLQEGIK